MLQLLFSTSSPDTFHAMLTTHLCIVVCELLAWLGLYNTYPYVLLWMGSASVCCAAALLALGQHTTMHVCEQAACVLRYFGMLDGSAGLALS